MRKTEEYSITLGEADSQKKNKPRKGALNIFEVFEAIIGALVVITILFTFFFRVFDVDGPSMKPTLQHNDKVIVSTVGYKAERGDIIVISETFDLDDIEYYYDKIGEYKGILKYRGEPDYDRISELIVNLIKKEKIKGVTFDNL